MTGKIILIDVTALQCSRYSTVDLKGKTDKEKARANMIILFYMEAVTRGTSKKRREKVTTTRKS